MNKDENKITIKQMFDGLTPTAIQVYGGKKVLFIVARKHFSLKNFDGIIIKDKSKTYEEQRNFVKDHVTYATISKLNGPRLIVME